MCESQTFRSSRTERLYPCFGTRFETQNVSITFPFFIMDTSAKESSKTQASTKPLKVFHARGVSVSVFANHAKSNGHDITFHKVSIQRAYKDGDDWKYTTSLGRDDLPIARLLLDQAWEFTLEAESSHTTEGVEE
jgi:hypothetical protein